MKISFPISSNFDPGPFPSILGKGPLPKLGEINDIEHYKGSKIYPQNQVILDCIIPSKPLEHKCLSIVLSQRPR